MRVSSERPALYKFISITVFNGGQKKGNLGNCGEQGNGPDSGNTERRRTKCCPLGTAAGPGS